MLVASSHFENQWRPVNLGVASVIAFYFISGYLMNQSFVKFKSASNSPIMHFYIDRLLRIYPCFFLIFFATFFWFKYVGIMELNRSVILQLLIIPSNYTNILNIPGSQLFPPLFSLGAEMQFYLALPLFLALNKKIQISILIIFFCAQMFFLALPYTFHSVPVSDLFGYRCFFFSFAAFLLGSITYDSMSGCRISGVAGLGIIGACFMLFFFAFPDKVSYSVDGVVKSFSPIRNPEAMNVLIGYMFFVPIAALIMTHKISNNHLARLNRFLGRLSYPVFLAHFLAIFMVGHIFGKGDINHWYFAQCMLVSIAIAICLAGIQTLIDLLRYQYRGFGSTYAKYGAK